MSNLLPDPLSGWAGGLAVMTLASYRRVWPYWLRGLLFISGLGLIMRDLGFAPSSWLLTTLGLTLPSVFAVDQLIRHPAMTPTALLRWCLPWFALSVVVSLAGWEMIGAAMQLLFALGFAGVSLLFIRKISSLAIRMALAGLMAGHLLYGMTALAHPWPRLYAETLLLLALWHAYETSARLQQA